MVLHTDEAHPHVHLIVANRDQDGRRFNPDREFLAHCRERFAENLRSRGVEADATRRAARGFPRRRENIATNKVRERGQRPLAVPQAAIDRHRAENMERVTSIYMRAIDELERHGGNSERSCATALRGLVASMTIMPLDRQTAARLMPDDHRVKLARLAEVTEKVRASAAKLNEPVKDVAADFSRQRLQRAAERLSQQAREMEKLILDRERTLRIDRERRRDRDMDGPTR